jgi:glyoxylase-like metal-dependent hydrolase (beta-lactamase superfamily II)
MPTGIKTINLGGVNCYLVKAGDDFILIDTGFSEKRTNLEKELENEGCKPGNLRLIVLTHGDSDHAGNCAYLREKYGAKIVMHSGDSGMVERGDMSWNRKPRPDKFSILFRIMSIFFRSGKFETFKPDLYIEDGYDLSEYGFDAKVLHIPGHSKGSVGILTSDGDLFCGDLLYNIPGFLFIDDLTDFDASIEKLKSLKINTVYPGHGKPFSWEQFLKRQR